VQPTHCGLSLVLLFITLLCQRLQVLPDVWFSHSKRCCGASLSPSPHPSCSLTFLFFSHCPPKYCLTENLSCLLHSNHWLLEPGCQAVLQALLLAWANSPAATIPETLIPHNSEWQCSNPSMTYLMGVFESFENCLMSSDVVHSSCSA
jgi:hypothetical protein